GTTPPGPARNRFAGFLICLQSLFRRRRSNAAVLGARVFDIQQPHSLFPRNGDRCDLRWFCGRELEQSGVLVRRGLARLLSIVGGAPLPFLVRVSGGHLSDGRSSGGRTPR